MTTRDTTTLEFRWEDWPRIAEALAAHEGGAFDYEERRTAGSGAGYAFVHEVNWWAGYADALVAAVPDVPWIAWSGAGSEEGERVFWHGAGDPAWHDALARDGQMVVPAWAADGYPVAALRPFHALKAMLGAVRGAPEPGVARA